jgi:hypothetical protein
MGESELRFTAYDGSLNGPVFIDFCRRLRLCFLPRYAPELNPDEWVWKHVKHDRIGRAGVTGLELTRFGGHPR